MKIAFLNISQDKVNRGGETYVYELSWRFSKNHKVDILTDKVQPFRRWPVLWRFFVDPQGLQILWFTLKNLSRIWKEKYDVVIPLNGGWQPAFTRLVTWLYGGKMVISGQSGIGWDDRNNLWSLPDSFIALSSKAKSWAKRANPLLRDIRRIPNGVDLTKFKPEGEAFKTGLKRPVILCVGAFTKQKRIDLVIRAVAKLEGVSLFVVGEGELKGYLGELGEKLLGDRFKLASLKREDMPQVYRAADVFTLVPQGSESFGIVYLEAMASNLAVVALKDAQRREIVGRGGILVDPTNEGAYAVALSNALRLRWGKRPLGQAKKFDWDRIALKYEKLFSDLVK